MSNALHILGIASTLRPKSFNRAALGAATQLAPEGATLDVFEIDGIPAFSENHESDPPAKVVELKRSIREADAVLFVMLETNYAIPGALKNALDWAAHPHGDSAWSGKPAAVMGASTSAFGTARAEFHLLQVMVSRRMVPLYHPEALPSANERFDAEGNLTDQATSYVRRLLHSLVDWTRSIREKGRSPHPS